MQLGRTLAGPHRDEMALVWEGGELRRFGSQGQRRIAAALLRMAEMRLLDEKGGERAVLILDDLPSELDEEAARRVLELVGPDRQWFLATPRRIAGWAPEGGREEVWEVTGGNVVVKQKE
jgi:DNA replication and repair protein RecF